MLLTQGSSQAFEAWGGLVPGCELPTRGGDGQDTKALATHECQVRVSLSGGAFGLTDGLNL